MKSKSPSECVSRDDVAWVLSGGLRAPGARIHGYNLHYQLLKSGIQSTILRGDRFVKHLPADEAIELADKIRKAPPKALIIQKLTGPHCVTLANTARKSGVRVIFHACDIVDNEMAAASDICLAGSSFLVSLYRRNQRNKFTVLDDAIETPESFRDREITIPEKGRLKAVYLSSSFPDRQIQAVLNELASIVDVTVLSRRDHSMEKSQAKASAKHSNEGLFYQLHAGLNEHGLGVVRRIGLQACYRRNRWNMTVDGETGRERFAFREWNLNDAFEIMGEHHIGLIPSVLDSSFKMSKSANRLATMMSMGLAVVASPVPSYLRHVRSTSTAVVANVASEWIRIVKRLDQDRERTAHLALIGREYAWQKFNITAITHELLSAIDGKALNR